MRVVGLRVDHLENPVGFLLKRPTLSFSVIEVEATHRDCFRIVVASDEKLSDILFDSGTRSDIEETGFRLDMDIQPSRRYYWAVFCRAGSEEAWSDVCFFESARKGEWKADFITQDFSQRLNPIFCRDFELPYDPKDGRISICALGVYELYLNGRKISDELLLPGIHAYEYWLQFQTFVLPLRRGSNHIEVRVGRGWYKGEYGLSRPFPFDRQHLCIAEIAFLDPSGERKTICTDRDWYAIMNPVHTDGIYCGESYDSTLSSNERFPVRIAKGNRELKGRLHPRLSPPIRVMKKMKPSLIISPKNEYILDFGQNLTGWLSFKDHEERGTLIKIQFCEILQDGCFYNENFRSAKAEFNYISNGKGNVVCQHYTFYGFRYARLIGFREDIDPRDFTALVIHTDMVETLEFRSSSAPLNRLVENIRWGMRGNFLDTPTDCPQRDERMGWTGDAEIFSDSACYLMDTYAFYRKYLEDLHQEQLRLDGSVPDVVPMARYPYHGSSVWGDAATIIPWTVFEHFGDDSILFDQYDSMKEWVEYIRRKDIDSGDRRLWTVGPHFGDWLALDGESSGGVYGATDRYFIASVYYWNSVSILARSAEQLDKRDEAEHYRALADSIREAIFKEYYSDEGRLSIRTETAYALVVVFDLIPENRRKRVYADFHALMRDNGFRLRTGFVGTRYLCKALAMIGDADIAYRILFDHSYPGWLYAVDLGATTIWERWDSVLPDGHINSTYMNSLNHYAYGAVLSFILESLAGFSSHSNGFRSVELRPVLSSELSHLSAKLRTPYGYYSIAWKVKGGRATFDIEIPFDCSAIFYIPDSCIVKDGTTSSLALEKGSYHFEFDLVKGYGRRRISLDLSPDRFLSIPKARRLLYSYFPAFKVRIPWVKEQKSMYGVIHSPFIVTDEETIARLERDLEKLDGQLL